MNLRIEDIVCNLHFRKCFWLYPCRTTSTLRRRRNIAFECMLIWIYHLNVYLFEYRIWMYTSLNIAFQSMLIWKSNLNVCLFEYHIWMYASLLHSSIKRLTNFLVGIIDKECLSADNIRLFNKVDKPRFISWYRLLIQHCSVTTVGFNWCEALGQWLPTGVLTRFFTISFKIHFQIVIKPQSKLLWVP